MTGPKVTLADIEAEIASEHYFTARDGVLGMLAADGVLATAYEQTKAAPAPLGLLTFCVLVLRNGFTVTGESACVSPDNFDAELGRKIAREKAIDKLWPLLGFRLRDRLATSMSWFIKPGKIDPQAWDELKPGGVTVQLTPEPAPTVSADDLAEAIADATHEYQAARIRESQDQTELERITERRRTALTNLAEATAAREKAGDRLLQITATNVQAQPGPELTSWQDRLEVEQKKVSERLHALTGFLGSPAFNAMPERERHLLEQQHTAMAAYASVLTERMDSITCNCGDNEACASCQGA